MEDPCTSKVNLFLFLSLEGVNSRLTEGSWHNSQKVWARQGFVFSAAQGLLFQHESRLKSAETNELLCQKLFLQLAAWYCQEIFW